MSTTIDLNKFHIHDAPYVTKLISGLLAEPHQVAALILETASDLLRERHDEDETACRIDNWSEAIRATTEESEAQARDEEWRAKVQAAAA